MAMPEGFEHMLVDVNEENDYDVDDGRILIGIPGNRVAAQPGAVTGSQQRGGVQGDDGSICYNVTNPCIDLEAYAQGYEGLARLYRLRFIGHHCPLLRLEALKLALSFVMSTHNTALFSELQKKLVAAVS